MFSILGLKALVYILIKPLNVSLHYSDGGMKTKQKKRNEPVSNLQEDNLPRLWTLVFHLRLLLSALYI